MAIFPGAVSTDADLYIAVNNLSTLLTDNPLTIGATTVNVISTVGFPTVGFISIDAEIIKYTGITATSFTGCTRGSDGTSASSHALNAQVDHNVIASHHNVLKDEVIAIESFISTRIGLTTLVTAAEFETLDGISSNIQTQLDGKAARNLSNVQATTAVPTDLSPTPNNAQDLGSTSFNWRDLYIGTSIKNGATTLATVTELGYLTGVTSAIQTQLNSKVGLAGTETITGIKTFSANPKLQNSADSFLLIETTGTGNAAFNQYKNTSFTHEIGIETSTDAGGGRWGGPASSLNVYLGANVPMVLENSLGSTEFRVLSTVTGRASYISFVNNSGNSHKIGIETDTDSGGGAFAGGANSLNIETQSSNAIVLSTNSTKSVEISSAGEITQPRQPSFLAHPSATVVDGTGDGTVVTINWATEIFDQGSDLSGTTFTAPVTGRYLLLASIDLEGLSQANHTSMDVNFVTSNRSYTWQTSDIPTSVTRHVWQMGVIADMDAGDTCTVTARVEGASKVVDINASGATLTRFSGSLIN